MVGLIEDALSPLRHSHIHSQAYLYFRKFVVGVKLVSVASMQKLLSPRRSEGRDGQEGVTGCCDK